MIKKHIDLTKIINLFLVNYFLLPLYTAMPKSFKQKKNFYKTNKKFRPISKNQAWKNKLIKLNKHLPNIYHFNRSTTWSFNLSEITESVPDTYFGPGFRWYQGSPGDPQAAVCQYRFMLHDVPDPTDFKHLFKYYKINGVSLKWYFSTGTGRTNPAENPQMMMYTIPSALGLAHTSSEFEELKILQSQVVKKKLCLKNDNTAENYYMKVKQISDTTIQDGSLRKALVTPEWIPFERVGQAGNTVDQDDVPHYGITQRIQTVNNSALPNISIKIIAKYYISCKQVR